MLPTESLEPLPHAPPELVIPTCPMPDRDSEFSGSPDSSKDTARLHGVRVVCFYPWVPFQVSGAWTRFTSLWRFLLDQGATVTLAFFESGQDTQLTQLSIRYLGELTVFHNMELVTRHVATTRPEIKQFTKTEAEFLLQYEKGLYLSTPKMEGFLATLVSSHDIVTCEYPLYAPLLSDYCRKYKKPLVVTSHDLLYELHGCHPHGKERLKECEIQAMRLADALVFCNDEERKQFEAFGLSGVTVLNTGDTLAITPGQEDVSRNTVRAGLKIKTLHYCLFVGSKHGPNVEAVAEVRCIAKLMPETTFIIAGACAPPGVEQNVVALGLVSAQMLDLLYRGARLVIVPLMRGTGTSVKTFEALTYAKAVVSTLSGARGLGVVDGRELLLASTSAEFPAAIRRVMTDEKLRGALGAQARQYSLTLDFRSHFQPYADIICRLLGTSGATRPKRSQALVLVDNTLQSRVGHHFNYALALKDQCARTGTGFYALINRDAADELRDELGAIGEFSAGIHDNSTLNPYPAEWGDLRDTYGMLAANDVFARELMAGLAHQAHLGDIVFLPNATPRQMLGLAAMLVNKPIYRMLRYVVLLRYSMQRGAGPISARKAMVDNREVEWYKLALNRLAAADQYRAVRLATDSSELAKEYEPLAKRKIEVLPIPHTAQPPTSVSAPDLPPKADDRIRVVFLGDARDEKGFELLPAVVRGCAAVPALANVEFVFHSYISSHFHYPMMPVIEELDRLKLPRLHLVKRPLSTDEYQHLLESSDLVLLPYDALTYRARTSGPFVEAICANKPVVVPGDTWMSAQLGDSRAGVTFKSGNAQDLIRGVREALLDIRSRTEAASQLGQQFRGFHNPEGFVAQLMSP